MNNPAIGNRGRSIVEAVEYNLLRFEELMPNNQQDLVKRIHDLVCRTLPAYLTGTNGKKVQKEACIVFPFTCYSFKKSVKMTGSGKPLLSAINTEDIVTTNQTPDKPYIIHSITIEQAMYNKKDRVYLTFEELVSWCIFNSAPNTAFFAASSTINKKLVGIEFDKKKNPKIIDSNVCSGINMPTRHREVIA